MASDTGKQSLTSRLISGAQIDLRQDSRNTFGSLIYMVVVVLFLFGCVICELTMAGLFPDSVVDAFSIYLFAGSCVLVSYLAVDAYVLRSSTAHQPLSATREDQSSRQPNLYGTVTGQELRQRHPGGATTPPSDDDSDVSIDADAALNGRISNVITTASMSHYATSVYLRAGFFVFSVGYAAFIILTILSYRGSAEECSSPDILPMYFLLAFILLQTTFIVWNPNLHVRRYKKVVRYGITHIIATNLCVWIITLVEDIALDIMNSSESETIGGVMFPEEAEEMVRCEPVLLVEVSEYLFPFIHEYSLIAIGCLVNMYAALNRSKGDVPLKKIRDNLQREEVEEEAVAVKSAASKEMKEGTKRFHNARVGLFFGAVVFVVLLGFSVSYVYQVTVDESAAAKIGYLDNVPDFIVHVILLITLICAKVKLKYFSFSNLRNNVIDDTMLLIGFSGYFFHALIVIIVTMSIQSTTDEQYTFLAFLATTYLVELIQILFQTMFILDGLQRFAPSGKERRAKPGRQAITFLLIVNAALWLFKSLVVKGVFMAMAPHVLGVVASAIIFDVTMPLVLFYRFHSSVCLADMWMALYEHECE